MANIDSGHGLRGEQTRPEAHGQEMLQILVGRGRSHDFLTGLSILLAAHGINTESLEGPVLDAVVRKEGISNVELVAKAEPKDIDEITKMHIPITVAKVLLASLLKACINVALYQEKVEFIGQAIEFARAFGITLESTAKA